MSRAGSAGDDGEGDRGVAKCNTLVLICAVVWVRPDSKTSRARSGRVGDRRVAKCNRVLNGTLLARRDGLDAFGAGISRAGKGTMAWTDIFVGVGEGL